ncbi:MAG TPA: hypothetical protein VGJ66_05380 [Pyrinomonadaceae bacterium]|jgi:hypothetical protein
MSKTTHKGNGHDPRHVTETPDVSHIKNPNVTHEASDVSVSGVLKFVLGLTVLGIVVFVLMWGMFDFLNAQEEEKAPKSGPMAMSPQERLPPDPKLQAAPGFEVTLENGERVKLENKEPEAEYRVLREQWERQLDCKSDELPPGAMDRKPACVPIDQAIDMLLAGGGLQVRPLAGQSKKPAAVTPPTAWSSGRTVEKGNE